MPTVVNGIGTWYYGKRRIHRIKGECGSCNAVGELESYDTSLYFVVFFIPILPLGQKRILDKCPQCQKHRVLSLKKWEASKAEHTAELLEKLQANPNDRDAVVSAISLAVTYQDEPLLDKMAATLADHRLDDAAIQAQLGVAYSYFARYEEAEAAFRASLAVQDNPEVHEPLALMLLKTHRPDEAAPHLQHILDAKQRDDVGMIYLLIEAYQAQGRHTEALELMDRRDTTFPDLAILPDYLNQRQFSEKHQHTGKPFRSEFLSSSSKAGYQEGNWTAKVPRLIGPIVLLGALLTYLGAAVWIGQARQVYVVNGANKPYTVLINGNEHKLSPGHATPIRIPEGDVAIEFRDVPFPVEPAQCRIETPFFSRPFASPTFVINPDQVGILFWEEAVYSENAGAPRDNAGKVHIGQLLHSFEGIDYEFVDFPESLNAKKGQTVRKTRISASPPIPSENRLAGIQNSLDDKGQRTYVKRFLLFEPRDVHFLHGLLGQLKDDEAIEFLKTRLPVRPLLIDWHRYYQTLMEKAHPETDLRPEYRQLVVETNQHPDALYLLGRLLDLDEADKLFQQAAAGNPPSVHAPFALGYNALARGEFADAVRWTEKAVQLAPDHPQFKQQLSSALLANREYDRLLEAIRRREEATGTDLSFDFERLRVYLAKGDKAKARSTIDTAVQVFKGPQRESVQAMLDLIVCFHENDVNGFLKFRKPGLGPSSFFLPLLEGKLQEAAGIIDDPKTNPHETLTEHALLYLFATKAGQKKLAEDQWKRFLDALMKTGNEERQVGDMLAGRQPVDAKRLRRLPIEPSLKRILLTVVAQRFPDQKKELLPLARQLDFQPDATSLCLRRVWE